MKTRIARLAAPSRLGADGADSNSLADGAQLAHISARKASLTTVHQSNASIKTRL
jgi:hypothetical protein